MAVAMVVPCYNERKRFDLEYWSGLMELPDVRWTFVDDGSSDDTGAILQSLVPLGAQVLRSPVNRGKAEAVRLGLMTALESARGDLAGVGFVDADGAFSIAEIARFTSLFGDVMERQPGFDALWSARVGLSGRNIQRSARRHYLGRVVATFLAVGTDLSAYDTQSGLKLFRATPSLEQCLASPFRTRWLFEVELLNRWGVTTGRPMRVWEEPLNEWAEIGGSKVTARETYRIARELITVKQLQRSALRGAAKGGRVNGSQGA